MWFFLKCFPHIGATVSPVLPSYARPAEYFSGVGAHPSRDYSGGRI